jgi:hypothetical protein
MDAMLAGTVGTAIEDPFGFHAVTNDLTPTVSARGRKRVDGTFETIEYMRFTIVHAHLKTFIIFVSAQLTFTEVSIPSKLIRPRAFCCFHSVVPFGY